AEPVRELQLKQALPDLGRRLMSEAAREPCVIAVPAAFAALADHPGAVHARLRAPFDWRGGGARPPHPPLPPPAAGAAQEARRPPPARVGADAVPPRRRR